MVASRAVERSVVRDVLPGALYIAAVFVGGSLPGGGGPPGISDKVMHFLVFLPLPWLVAKAIVFAWPGTSGLRRLLVATVATSVAGGLLELWQYFLPHRTCELLDWVADTAGAGVGVLLGCGVRTLLGRGKKSDSQGTL